jgi:nucleotidyltransferase substrate binding protein (TIGR01987 family)
MKNKIGYSVGKLKEANTRLEDGLSTVKDDLGIDGVIQRFEFTFELLWKTFKVFLEDKGILCHSPKDCLKAAFKYGLITDELIFIKMLDDRNILSHVYDLKQSRDIFDRIKKDYFESISTTIKTIESHS